MYSFNFYSEVPVCLMKKYSIYFLYACACVCASVSKSSTATTTPAITSNCLQTHLQDCNISPRRSSNDSSSKTREFDNYNVHETDHQHLIILYEADCLIYRWLSWFYLFILVTAFPVAYYSCIAWLSLFCTTVESTLKTSADIKVVYLQAITDCLYHNPEVGKTAANVQYILAGAVSK